MYFEGLETHVAFKTPAPLILGPLKNVRASPHAHMYVCIYVCMQVTGFMTFGGMSKGLILNNYATSDVLATVACHPVALCMHGTTRTHARTHARARARTHTHTL